MGLSLTGDTFEKKVFLAFLNNVVQEQCDLRVSLTGGALKKVDISSVPER